MVRPVTTAASRRPSRLRMHCAAVKCTHLSHKTATRLEDRERANPTWRCRLHLSCIRSEIALPAGSCDPNFRPDRQEGPKRSTPSFSTSDLLLLLTQASEASMANSACCFRSTVVCGSPGRRVVVRCSANKASSGQREQSHFASMPAKAAIAATLSAALTLSPPAFADLNQYEADAGQTAFCRAK